MMMQRAQSTGEHRLAVELSVKQSSPLAWVEPELRDQMIARWSRSHSNPHLENAERYEIQREIDYPHEGGLFEQVPIEDLLEHASHLIDIEADSRSLAQYRAQILKWELALAEAARDNVTLRLASHNAVVVGIHNPKEVPLDGVEVRLSFGERTTPHLQVPFGRTLPEPPRRLGAPPPHAQVHPSAVVPDIGAIFDPDEVTSALSSLSYSAESGEVVWDVGTLLPLGSDHSAPIYIAVNGDHLDPVSLSWSAAAANCVGRSFGETLLAVNSDPIFLEPS